ncbi:protein kinase [Streptomyces sp. CG1]|uniref:serine/threonine-protein kinase n=1 Tax=Streptomyces sp. CG1 TaxID=1287523 RepID=UPI0034E253B4
MGEVFAGRYELADPIGRGGVGAVWRAWDHRRRRYVAAKVLQQRDAHSLLRFVREQALRIDHPHVLAPASWAADDDKVLFTMDLVGGGSLVHLVGDYGPLPPAFVCTLLDQLLSGLAAVHAEGVIHRDIKPANVLLEATGTGRPRLRLSDFGIAMRLGEPRLTETNLVVGTPGYLAPEQMLGSEPDFPADLFAVGLVALYLLEGAKPDAKALVEYFADHGTPGPPKGIPEPLWQVVATLLQPDPDARFRTATGARKALAAATELLPEPEPDDELIEIFDQLGPLPPGFAPDGPLKQASGVALELVEPVEGVDTTPVPAADPAPSPGPGTDSLADPGTGSLSDTGSFRLPPPQEPSTPEPYPQQPPRQAAEQLPHTGAPSPYPPYVQLPQPPSALPSPLPPHQPYYSPHTPTPSAMTGHDTSTASYTTQDAQAPPPPPPQPISGAPAQRHRASRSRRAGRSRRTGPPAKVAIPMLLLALACYAVGFWALTRV